MKFLLDKRYRQEEGVRTCNPKKESSTPGVEFTAAIRPMLEHLKPMEVGESDHFIERL